MKVYMLLAAAVVTLFVAQSCRKCYTCTSDNLVDKVCPIDGDYAFAKQGQLTDGQGDTMVCKF